MGKQKLLSEVSGIYCILNTGNGKRYIGQTVDLSKRFSGHRKALENNRHPCPYLQHSYNKHGAEKFEYLVLERCSVDELFQRELHWISYYKSNHPDHGYNLRLDPVASRGIKLSEKTKRLMSAAHKGKKPTAEHSRKSAESRRGAKRSDDQKMRMAMGRKGQDAHVVSLIKGLLKDKSLTLAEIAAAVGVSFKYVSRIKLDDILWAVDIAPAPAEELPVVPEKNYKAGTTKAIPQRRLSRETIIAMLAAYRDEGLSARRMSKRFGVSRSSADALLKGELQWVRDAGIYDMFGL